VYFVLRRITVSLVKFIIYLFIYFGNSWNLTYFNNKFYIFSLNITIHIYIIIYFYVYHYHGKFHQKFFA